MSENETETSNMINEIDELADSANISIPPTQSITSLLADCSFSTPSTPVSPSFSSSTSSGNNLSSPYSNSSNLTPNISKSTNKIKSFLSDFNQQFDVSAQKLSDIIGIVCDLLDEKGLSSQKEDDKNIQKLNDENLQLKTEIDKLNLQIAEMKTKISTLEYNNTKLKQSYDSLQVNYKCLEEESKGYQSNIESMQSEWEGQITDLQSLGNQRNNLYKIANRQMQLINKLETELQNKTNQLNNAKKVTQVQETAQNKEKAPSSDELYTILCSMVRVIEEDLKNDAFQCRIIRDESRLSINDRITKLIKYLTDKVKEKETKEAETDKSLDKATKQADYYHDKCREVLTLFESQLDFLQKLTHSADLQNTVFFQENTGNSLQLTDENKALLIRKCANLGKFVEETIGALTEERFNETFNAPDSVDKNRIFDLLNPQKVETVLEDILDKIAENTELDAREMFDLFCGQLYMNSLLKNHVSELHTRIAQCTHEILSLRQQNSEVDIEAVRDINRKLGRCEQKFEKIRRFLSQFVEVDQTTPTIKLIKQAMLAVQQAAKSVPSEESSQTSQSIKEEIERVTIERDQTAEELRKEKILKDKIGKKLIIQAEKTKKQLVAAQQELISIKEKCLKLSGDVETLKKIIQEKSDENQQLNNQIEEIKKENEQKVNELEDKNKKSEEHCQELTKKIEENEQILLTVKKQRQSLGKKIETLQNTNKALKSEIEAKTNELKDQYAQLVNDLQSRYQNALSDLETVQNGLQNFENKNQQLSSELKQARVEKKTLEMKIKSLEQRMSLDQQNMQSRIAAQVTAAQIEQASQVNSVSKINEEAMNEIIALLPDGAKPSNLMTAIHLLQDDYNSLKQTQYKYIELLNDVSESQKILGIDSSSRICDSLNEFIQKCEDKMSADTARETKWKQGQEELERARKDIKKADLQIAELKKWDSWARRSHRAIYDADTANMTNDEIRLTLEEALLSSVSHKSVFYRIDSLRTQKELLMRYDKRVLNTRSIMRPSIRSVLVVALSARRMMKLGGILPLNILDNAFSRLSETPRTTRQTEQRYERYTPKSTTKVSKRSTTTTTRRPLYPVLM